MIAYAVIPRELKLSAITSCCFLGREFAEHDMSCLMGAT